MKNSENSDLEKKAITRSLVIRSTRVHYHQINGVCGIAGLITTAGHKLFFIMFLFLGSESCGQEVFSNRREIEFLAPLKHWVRVHGTLHTCTPRYYYCCTRAHGTLYARSIVVYNNNNNNSVCT